jgi:hypothetical protein
MKQINKTRYKKNMFIKSYTYINRNRGKYSAIAAVLFLVVISATVLAKFNIHSNLDMAMPQKSSSTATSNSLTGGTMSSSHGTGIESSKQDVTLDSSSTEKMLNIGTNNQITFKRQSLNSNSNTQKLGDWKTSLNNKYEACIEEKVNDVDFGIRKLYLKEKNSGDIWSFEINNIGKDQYTPMYLEWMGNDKDLLIIIGLAYGTVNDGGSIYKLNLETGNASLVYKPNKLEQVKNFQYKNGAITAAIKVFENESFNEYHVDNINISESSLKSFIANMNSIPKEASIVYEYQEDINNNRQSAAIKLVSEKQINEKKFDEENLLKNINNMNVSEIIQINSGYDINDISKGAYKKEVFSATIEYKLKATMVGNLNQGSNKAIVVLTKDDEKSEWKIGEIQIKNK